MKSYALLHNQLSRQKSTRDPVRVLLIGLGSRGLREFFPVLTSASGDLWRLAAVCDSSPARLAEFEHLLAQNNIGNDIAVSTDAAAIPAVLYDIPLIATPHDQHAPIIMDLLPTAKPILTEKPLAHNLQEALKFCAMSPCIRTLADRMYSASSLLVKNLIAEIAPIRGFFGYSVLPSPSYRATWRNDPAKAGGGVLMDLGYHLVDMCLRLLGYPENVSAREVSPRRLGYLVEEDVEMYLRCANGIAKLRASRLGRYRSEVFSLSGEHGSIHWSADSARLERRGKVYAWRINDTAIKRASRMLSREILLALQGSSGLNHALSVQAAIDALYRSLPSGTCQRPISIENTRLDQDE